MQCTEHTAAPRAGAEQQRHGRDGAERGAHSGVVPAMARRPPRGLVTPRRPVVPGRTSRWSEQAFPSIPARTRARDVQVALARCTLRV